MPTPWELAKEYAGAVKQTVYPDPEASRLTAEMKTEEADKDFRQLNYKKPVVKPVPIKLSPKRSTSKVDYGGKR